MANTGSTRTSPRDVRAALVNENKFVHEEFLSSFNAFVEGTPMGNPTGATGDVNGLKTDRNMFQYHIIGAGQSILAPKRVATGLDVSLDLTNNEGMELTLGCEHPKSTVVSALSRGTFTVGTDAPFYIAVKLNNLDVSGLDECMVGLRKSELYQSTIEDDYDEMAVLNAESGDIKVRTILNDGATTVTDTTVNWTDDTTRTLLVICDSDGTLWGEIGACYFEIDNTVPASHAPGASTAVSTFKFDSGEVVIPFFAFRHDSDVGQLVLKLWESGHVGAGETSQYAGQVFNS